MLIKDYARKAFPKLKSYENFKSRYVFKVSCYSADIPGKTSGVAGITPPASEVGSDEILARNHENTCGGMKRKTRASESPQKSKRPKRSLIDSYLIKNESGVKKTKEEEEEDDEEEEEFEVESIIDFKKTQVSRAPLK